MNYTLVARAEDLVESNKVFNEESNIHSAIREYLKKGIVRQPIDFKRGVHKYTWQSDLVIEFEPGTILLFKITAIGNGGWLGYDEYRITEVHEVRGTRVVEGQRIVEWLLCYK